MALSIIVPLAVLLVGLVVYLAVQNNGKVAELSRIAFAVGLFWLVAEFATHVFRF